jgi:hypothetical protein
MSKKHIYFHDIETIYASHGELHLHSVNGEVTFNMDTLVDDLPIIIDYCIKNIDKRKEQIYCEMEKLKTDDQ